MASDPAVRALRADDLPAVTALLRAEWPGIDWERRLARVLGDDAATPSSSSLPRGFVHVRDGALLGFFGSIVMPYQIDGARGTACIATALCVQRTARGRGVGRALVQAFDAQPCDLRINATPNDASAALFAGLGYVAVDAAAGRHVLAHACQPFGALRRAWRARSRGALRALAAALLPVPPPDTAALPCAPLPAASDELDALWQRHRGRHPTTLWRDHTTLRWLVFADPRTTVLGCRDATGTLRGYAAFRDDRGELRQIDAFPAHDDDVLVALAHAGTRRAAELGIAVVRLLSVTKAAADRLQRAGFEPVAGDVSVLVRPAPGRAAWFTRLDGDRWL